MAYKPGKTKKTDSSSTSRGKPKVEWQGYVTFELAASHKAALAKQVEIDNDPLLWLPKIATDGIYEVKTKWDSFNNCWVTTLYCSRAGHPHAGWSLPARASDYWESQRRAAFVHVEVLKESWHVGADDTGWNDDNW